MPADTLICGVCQKVFTDLNEFVVHKQHECADNLPEPEVQEAGEAVSNLVAAACAAQTDSSPPASDQTLTSQTVIPKTEPAVVEPDNVSSSLKVVGPTTGTGRKRGRPRKSEQKKKPPATPPAEEQPVESGTAATDGRVHCSRCKKSFFKQRHLKTHRCLADTDYVDITKKDLKLDSNDEMEEDEEEGGRTRETVPMVQLQQLEPDFTRDFDPPVKKVKIDENIVRKIRINQEASSITCDILVEQTNESEGVPKLDETKETKPEYVVQEQALARHKNLPIFQNQEEKDAFGQMLKVDLSFVDHLFKVHMVQQETNELAPPPSSRTSDQLSLYSCNVCSKVFKSLSHCRFHCIIHTDSKPFKCYKCDFRSSSKGNLYTHVRRHTGQMYRCTHCSFKTANRTHLVEHESVHSRRRHLCQICRKDYSSAKSLVNHVRVYHKSKTGRVYLEKLNYGTSHEKGVAVLHQCHVCNRKFKKKNDRDRHLFIHNIQVNPEIQSCELCGYMVSRRIYMEKHIQKHRVIYKCCLCQGKFPSVIRLNQHLQEKHEAEVAEKTWQNVFEECINSSLYLPEPNCTWDQVESDIAENAQCKIEVVMEVHGEGGPIAKQSSSDCPVSDTKSDENLDVESSPQGAVPDMVNHDVEDLETDSQVEVINVTADYNDLFKKLKYKQMDMPIFQWLRNQYGNEECDFCGKLFYSKADFEPHHRTHTGDKPFACDQCDFKAVTKDNLKRHIERQHTQLTFPCPKCEFVGETRHKLWRHEQSHRQPNEVQCPKCSLKLDTVKKLRSHIAFQHPDVEKDEMEQITSQNVRSHGKIGKRSYKCPYCPKLFLRASADLQKHIWIHQGVKPYKCPVVTCNHACRSKNNLAAHMLRHSAEKPFLCTECGKAYKSRTALRWHFKTHKDGKTFKCSRCDYQAVQKSHLKRHEETHFITKKYVCQHCDYSSNTLGYMKIHYTRKHKGFQYTHNPGATRPLPADAKVFRCLSCDYLFGNLTDMKRHLKVRHHVKLENVDVLEAAEVMTQIVPQEGAETQIAQPDVQKIQVVELSGQAAPPTPEETDASAALQTLRYSVPGQEVDEKTASAISLIQQIVMSHQAGTGVDNTLTVPDADGQRLVTVDPSSIIVQEDGQEVILSTDGTGEGHQYVIQYVTQDEMAAIRPNITSIQQVITEENGDVITDLNPTENLVELPIKDPETIVTHQSYITTKSQDIDIVSTTNVPVTEAMENQMYVNTRPVDVITEEVVHQEEEKSDQNKEDIVTDTVYVADDRDGESGTVKVIAETLPQES